MTGAVGIREYIVVAVCAQIIILGFGDPHMEVCLYVAHTGGLFRLAACAYADRNIHRHNSACGGRQRMGHYCIAVEIVDRQRTAVPCRNGRIRPVILDALGVTVIYNKLWAVCRGGRKCTVNKMDIAL